jgi:hypothetical protein
MAEKKNQVVKRFSVTYQVTLQVDVERTPTNRDELFRLKPTCKAELVDEPFDQYEPFLDRNNKPMSLFSRDFDLEKNPDFVVNFVRNFILKEMEKELCRASESLYQEAYFQGTRGNARDDFIKGLINKTEIAIRKRLIAPKGRTPIKESEDYERLRQAFLDDCMLAFRRLEAKGARINKRQLAIAIFGDGEGLYTQLNREFEKFDLDFDTVWQIYSEHKSS